MRPLTLKAGDNKILAGVTNSAILPTVAASASRVQRGFVPLRQLTQNILDLDFRARQAALQYQNDNILHRFSGALTLEMLGVVTGLPMMVLFDYAAAFPSIAHAWIDAVLRTIKVPRGVLNVFRALYKSNQAYAAIGSNIVWLFVVGCGVLQGCPFSGTLFVIAIDPLLHMFEKYIISPGFGHVYAGDIGVVLHECRMLIRLYNLFYIMELASGLKLKPSKCVLVPVAIEASVHNVQIIRKWLEQYLPPWSDFLIKSSGKYLGVIIGPNDANDNWEKPLAKFCERVTQIAGQDLPMELAASKFASKAVSVLGYIAQLLPPPLV